MFTEACVAKLSNKKDRDKGFGILRMHPLNVKK